MNRLASLYKINKIKVYKIEIYINFLIEQEEFI